MPSKQKLALAFLIAAGFFLASHDAFSRAVPAHEATERTCWTLDLRLTCCLQPNRNIPARLKGAATLRIKPVRSDA